MRWRFDLLHPSNTRLRAWLETGEPDGVGEHVEQCERCADRLEQLDDDDVVVEGGTGGALGQALSSALSPPTDLRERVMRGVANRSRVDEELQLFAGLFSIGIETARLMIEPDVHQDRADEAFGTDNGRGPSQEDDT